MMLETAVLEQMMDNLMEYIHLIVKSFSVLVRCSTDYIYIIMSFVLCYYNAHKVHGFVNATYDVVEDEILETFFQLNVKGETAYPTLYFRGTILSDAAGTASKSHENVKIIFSFSVHIDLYRLFRFSISYTRFTRYKQ